MSKMGQELDRKLDEAKYDLYEALIGMMEYAGYSLTLPSFELSPQDKRDRVIAANKALAKAGFSTLTIE